MTDQIKIYFHIDTRKEEAQKTADELIQRYGQTKREEATHIVVIGGDGALLQLARDEIVARNLPIYGLNFGTRGFLLNDPTLGIDDLPACLAGAVQADIPSLKVEATSIHGETKSGYALNEVLIDRQTSQATRLCISLGEKNLYGQLDGDGVLISTHMGCSGYSHAAGGRLITSKKIAYAITPKDPIRLSGPRAKGLFSYEAVQIKKYSAKDKKLHIEVQETLKRSAHVYTDTKFLIGNAQVIDITEDHTRPLKLLFHPSKPLEAKRRAQARLDTWRRIKSLLVRRTF